MLAVANLLRISTPNRVIVYIATIVNVSITVLVAATWANARYDTLQAQEDFGVFMLIVGISGFAALLSFINLVLVALQNIKLPKFWVQMMMNKVITLGLLNCAAPFILAFALLELARG